MHGSTVFLVAFLTAALTATGTVYLIEKNDLLQLRQKPAVAETVVPDWKGFSEADTRANAQATHITLVVSSREPSADAKPGTVIRQSVPAGQRVPHLHPVSVVIAEELPKVPSLKGLVLVEAKKRAEALGYKLEAEKDAVADATAPAGSIVNQTPDPDSALEKGKTISVQLSGGPGESPVPKVLGFTVANAKKALEKAGFEATVRWVSLAETPTFVVLNQKPPANEKLKAGSKVEIVVNQ